MVPARDKHWDSLGSVAEGEMGSGERVSGGVGRGGWVCVGVVLPTHPTRSSALSGMYPLSTLSSRPALPLCSPLAYKWLVHRNVLSRTHAY